MRKGPEDEGEAFFEVGIRRSLKVNADKSKVMVLGGEEGLESKIHQSHNCGL